MMKNFRKKIDMAITVGLSSIWARKKEVCSTKNRILIVVDGGMGDIFVDGQAIIEMVRYYDSMGKEVYLVCETPAWKTFWMLADMEKVHFIQHDFSGNEEGKRSTQRLKNTHTALKNLIFDDVYIFFNGCSEAFCVAADVSAARRTTVLYDEKNDSLKRKIRNAFIWKHIDNITIVPQGCTHSERSRKLALAAGVPAYPIRILHIPQKINEPILPKKRYITVAVDSTRSMRRWKPERFIELIWRLLEYFDYDVLITGNRLDEAQTKQYDEAFAGCGRVRNVIGKQTLREWIEIIRGSQFHIGVDSGSVHVAAAVGTQSFCLTGKWDEEKFFPYKVEEDATGTTDPICVYRSDIPINELACAGCKSHGGYGAGNSECLKKCRAGLPCLCLEKITVNDVMRAIQDAESRSLI